MAWRFGHNLDRAANPELHPRPSLHTKVAGAEAGGLPAAQAGGHYSDEPLDPINTQTQTLLGWDAQ